MICGGCVNATITQRLDRPKSVQCVYLGRVPHDLVFCSKYSPTRVDAYIPFGALIVDPREEPPSAKKGYV